MTKVLLVSGKRKTAIARATIRKGRGMVRVNNVPLRIYGSELARSKIMEPLLVAGDDITKKIDIHVRVRGGGYMGQADAVRTAIARGLANWSKNVKLREDFIQYDRKMLVGDPRRTEPKKFGGHSARARKQKSYR